VTAHACIAGRLLLPIRLGMDPMERLLVASLKGDPEFEALEPQVFDDERNGHGMRMLRYRHDGRVDIYFQPGVHVDLVRYTIGTGVGDFTETTIDPCRFIITGRSGQILLSSRRCRILQVSGHETRAAATGRSRSTTCRSRAGCSSSSDAARISMSTSM
jgi:hypothetical protein